MRQTPLTSPPRLALLSILTLAVSAAACSRPSPPAADDAAPTTEAAPAAASAPADPLALEERLYPPESERLVLGPSQATQCKLSQYNQPPPEGSADVEETQHLDASGRVIRVEYTNHAAAHAYTELRSIDGSGRISGAMIKVHESVDGPGEKQLTYSYAVSGRTVTARQKTTGAGASDDVERVFEFDESGRVARVSLKQGSLEETTRCTYRGQWPSKIELTSKQRSWVQSYSYDEEGRLLGFVTRAEGDSPRPQRYVQVIRAREGGFTVEQVDGAQGGRDDYEGNCLGILFTPCSRALAPPAP